MRKRPNYGYPWLKEFFKRRARRILPAYYAALITAVGLVYASKVAHLIETDGHLNATDILSHLFLVHNWTIYSRALDGPMWSVAVEWQIYFIFAIALLPVFLRFGMIAVVSVAFIVGIIPHLFLRNHTYDDQATFYVVGFAFGMAASWVNFSPDERAFILRSHIPWLQISLVAMAVVITLCAVHPIAVFQLGQIPFLPNWAADGVVEMMSAMLIIGLTKIALTSGGKDGIVIHLLEHPWLVRFGIFSYSVYLVHQLLLRVFVDFFAKHMFHLDEMGSFCLVIATLPVLIYLCYLFYLVFERPFISKAKVSEAAG